MKSQIGKQPSEPISSAVRIVCRAAMLCLLFGATNGRSGAAEDTSRPPFPTGSHLQLVRTFYTTADGLPANRVRALAATRNGAVLAACENGVSRLDGTHWVAESGPVGVTALFAPTQGPDALAGATNGVWAFANNRWQQEMDGPEGVIAFAAEPDGTPWALATSGVWRKAKRWERVHTTKDDLMFGPRDLMPTGPEDVLVASKTGLYALKGKRKYWLPFEIRPGGLLRRQYAGDRAV